jgi:hypothetical protein
MTGIGQLGRQTRTDPPASDDYDMHHNTQTCSLSSAQLAPLAILARAIATPDGASRHSTIKSPEADKVGSLAVPGGPTDALGVRAIGSLERPGITI